MSSGWKILHLQLSDLGRLELEPAYAGLFVCFWKGNIPLGHRHLLAPELPLSETQVRNLAAGAIAPAVNAYVSANAMTLDSPLRHVAHASDPSLTRDTSLVICTRKRPGQLERCLNSVMALAHPPWETLVIDNTPGHAETERVVRSHSGVRYIIEPRPGLSRARNAGVRQSSGSLIAFTDDDISLGPDWLAELTSVFHDPKVSAASGLVLPAELRTDAQLIFETDFGGFNQGYEPRCYGPDFLRRHGRNAAPVWSICTGGNAVVRRHTFERFGYFDERLGAGAAGCSEDSEFWYRILSGGGYCAYVPCAAVHHHHRATIEEVRRQIYLYMRGHVMALLVQFANTRDWSNLHRVFLELPFHSAELLARWLVRGGTRQRMLLSGISGSTAGLWYWLTHPRHSAAGTN